MTNKTTNGTINAGTTTNTNNNGGIQMENKNITMKTVEEILDGLFVKYGDKADFNSLSEIAKHQFNTMAQLRAMELQAIITNNNNSNTNTSNENISTEDTNNNTNTTNETTNEKTTVKTPKTETVTENTNNTEKDKGDFLSLMAENAMITEKVAGGLAFTMAEPIVESVGDLAVGVGCFLENLATVEECKNKVGKTVKGLIFTAGVKWLGGYVSDSSSIIDFATDLTVAGGAIYTGYNALDAYSSAKKAITPDQKRDFKKSQLRKYNEIVNSNK